MSHSLINESTIDDHILLVELNNPPVNVLSRQVRAELLTVFKGLKRNPQIRVVLLSGSNQVFCCGDDLKEASINLQSGVEHVKSSLKEFGQLMLTIENCQIPTIGLIDGWCIGGGLELALCTDIRLASPNAKFKGAGVNIGLMASTYRLPHLIGLSKSKELLYTGRQIDAAEALQIGLVNKVCNSASLINDGITMAKTIAAKAPLSVQATKESINSSYQHSKEENELINEKLLMSLAESNDYKRAVKAHLKKEKPNFQGD